MDVITADHLVKRFGPLEAVRDVSFAVREGEIFGFLGPNGAGKSTTINMLCTLLRPTDGTAEVAGFDVVAQRNQVRRSIGLVFQDTTLDEYLTADRNLWFHAVAYGMSADVRERRTEEVLDLVGLSERRASKVSTFSGGMKRRLEIARGLMHHPRVLFLDEPTLGLDPQTRHHIWRYVGELRARERLTIFLTTHYMDEAENCDRIAVIDNGRIAALDTPENLKSSLGGDVISVSSERNDDVVRELRTRYELAPEVHDGMVEFAVPRGDEFLPGFLQSFPFRLQSIRVRRPTLDDVFLSLTGHSIRDEEADPKTQMMRAMMRDGRMASRFSSRGGGPR